MKNKASTTRRPFTPSKPIATFAATTNPSTSPCVICMTDKHPLYACSKFRSMPHDKKTSTLKENDLCMNCLGPGHFIKMCKSVHRCKKCQKPHHSLLHVENQTDVPSTSVPPTHPISSNTAVGMKSSTLFMTCRVLVGAPDGPSVEVRAILDSALSASFILECLAQSLCLPHSNESAKISGIIGLSHKSPIQFIASFSVSAVKSSSKKIGVTTVVVSLVMCFYPIPFDLKWNHLSNLQLADPAFDQPGKINILLGVDAFVGPPGSPVAFETEFGWVLAGRTDSCTPTNHITTYHASLVSGDDILRKFWEVEEQPMTDSALSTVVHHFKNNHYHSDSERFVVLLPKKFDAKPLGELRSQAVRRFLCLERSLHAKGQFNKFNVVMKEYFDIGHAEPVPT